MAASKRQSKKSAPAKKTRAKKSAPAKRARAAVKKPAVRVERAPAKRAAAKRPAVRAPREARSELDTVSWWDDFYRVVRRIPAGRVTTYGAVALFAGRPRAARHVGYAMAALKDTRKNRDVPWQRVLGAAPRNRAHVTIKDPIGGAMQRALLEAEGVRFDANGRVSLDTFGWDGPTRARGPAERSPKPSRKGPRGKTGLKPLPRRSSP